MFALSGFRVLSDRNGLLMEVGMVAAFATGKMAINKNCIGGAQKSNGKPHFSSCVYEVVSFS